MLFKRDIFIDAALYDHVEHLLSQDATAADMPHGRDAHVFEGTFANGNTMRLRCWFDSNARPNENASFIEIMLVDEDNKRLTSGETTGSLAQTFGVDFEGHEYNLRIRPRRYC